MTTIIVGIVCFVAGSLVTAFALGAGALASKADDSHEAVHGPFEESDHTAMLRG